MKLNYTVGTDIVEVERLRRLGQDYGDRFFKHVFTKHEVDWCQSFINPYIHLAGKFAAKEAVKKALMAIGESPAIPVNTIEIFRKHGQPPEVRIFHALSQSYTFRVSISHTEELATAIAIAEIT